MSVITPVNAAIGVGDVKGRTKVSKSTAPTATLYVDSQLKYSEAFDVLKKVNAERKKVGASELKMDTELLAVAMLRAEETAIYFSHTRPNGEICFTASDKIWGENIAAGQTNATAVMNSWMNSPGHKENILTASYQSIGIGCTVINGVTYWVQLFGNDNAATAAQSSYKNQQREANISVNPQASFYSPTLKIAQSDLKVGGTTTLTYQINNSFVDLAAKAKSFTFTSSNTSVCTVNASGKITATGGGTATVSAYPKGFSNVKSSVKVTVASQPSFTVRYHANKGTGSMDNTSVVIGKNTALKANVFKRTGYTFGGWNIQRKSDNKWLYTKGGKDGWYKKNKQPSGYKLKSYKNKARISNVSKRNKEVITAYATWNANKYTVSYHRNGGKGKISNTKISYAQNARLKSNTFKRNKHTFRGWSAYRRSDKKWLYVKGSKAEWYVKGAQPAGYNLRVFGNRAKIKNLTTVRNDKITMYANWRKR